MQALATMTAANLTGCQDASPLVRHKNKKALALLDLLQWQGVPYCAYFATSVLYY
jgi:hypothetical protein